MVLAKVLIVIAVAASSLQQEATFKCDMLISRSLFLYSPAFSSSSFGQKCTYENVKKVEDLEKARQAGSSLRANQQISSIIFKNSSLSKLPDKMFEGYIGIRTLDASRLVLSEISTTTFSGVKSWDSIDLSNNQITKLNDRTFSSMHVLNLDLSMNLIETIEDKTFNSASIQKLNLSFNKLKSLQFLGFFSFFKMIEINDNLLESFKVQVDKESWVRLPSLFEDDKAKFLLQNNKFQTFDCASNIPISSINLENNPSLTSVALNKCEVGEIDVSSCGSLKQVSFNDNLLGFTAKNVRLNDVDVSGAKSLTSLSMANSSVPKAVVENIMKMENLTFLDLSYINIGPLSISTFSKLKSLQSLQLKATNISNIQFGTFSHQHAVKELDVSDNRLGYFDMNMIFSMNSLLSLDLSGNDLTSIENVDSAHFTFTLLQRIDLSNNNWPCSYLMRLIKIFRVYKVVLTRSNLEEKATNIHGISCVHVQGDDDVIEPLSADSANITDLRDKLNELIEEVGKNSQYRTNFDARLRQMESKVDSQMVSFATSGALHSDKSQNIEVRNSSLLEFVLFIVCICFVIFCVMKAFVYVKTNFLGQPRAMRGMSSERHLAMSVDDF